MVERRNRRDFTREEVLPLLSYEPETGLFRWKVARNSYGGGIQEGSLAGGVKDGYVRIALFGLQYRAHHIAWLLMTGDWPTEAMDVEHRDRCRSNNAWSNLRLATRYQNIANVGVRVSNRSGFTGVSFRKDTGKWHARIKVDGRIILLGNFAQIEDAVEARRAAEKQYHGEFAAV